MSQKLSSRCVHGAILALLVGSLSACSGGSAESIDPGPIVLDAGPDAPVDTQPDVQKADAKETEPQEAAPACTNPPELAACGGLDSDCDGISDAVEGRYLAGGPRDTDKDGIPDYLDEDSDNDGIPDKVEWVVPGCQATNNANDADGDGIPNYLDEDSDNNGLLDKYEACPPKNMPVSATDHPNINSCTPKTPYDFDKDGTPDYLDFDNDGDSSEGGGLGLADKIELADNSEKINIEIVGGVPKLIDTDKDGIPDIYDVDSDNDGIMDHDEGTSDPDSDGIPNFRDDDSDGDKIPDKCEGHGTANPTAADLKKKPIDSDKDGIPDYLDSDSDNDFVLDKDEDKNGNCIKDNDETDRLSGDTDKDGSTDLEEIATAATPAAGVANANNPSVNPKKNGDFVFLVPYSADGSKKPDPANGTLAMSTKIRQGDVAFIVDTTGSMQEEITGLKNNLQTIITALKSKFEDLGVGVAGYEDFPVNGNGATDSLPFYVTPRSSTTKNGTITTDATIAQNAVQSLGIKVGGDDPESTIPAMMRALTGKGFSWGSLSSQTVTDYTAPTGFKGALHFRQDALPILIPITDADFHNGKRALTLGPPVGTTSSTHYDSAFRYPYTSPVTSSNVDDLVTAMNAIGAKIIGVASDTQVQRVPKVGDDPATKYPYANLAYIADKTNSVVPESAFFPEQTCATGFDGQLATADGPTNGTSGPTCRLVFAIQPGNGSGLDKTIISGVNALLAGISFKVYLRGTKGTVLPGSSGRDAIDAFIDNLPPSTLGGTDPITGENCLAVDGTKLEDNYKTPKALSGKGDISESVSGLTPNKLYCFKVVPKANTEVVPLTKPQVFEAFIEVLADRPSGTPIKLGKDRKVIFIVPPSLN